MKRKRIIKTVAIIGYVILAIFGVYLFVCNFRHYVPKRFEETIMMFFIAYGFFIGPMCLIASISGIKDIVDHWWW